MITLWSYPTLFLSLAAFGAFGRSSTGRWWWWDGATALFNIHNHSKFLPSCTSYKFFLSSSGVTMIFSEVVLSLDLFYKIYRDVTYNAMLCRVASFYASSISPFEKSMDFCNPSMNGPFKRDSSYTGYGKVPFLIAILHNIMRAFFQVLEIS